MDTENVMLILGDFAVRDWQVATRARALQVWVRIIPRAYKSIVNYCTDLEKVTVSEKKKFL